MVAIVIIMLYALYLYLYHEVEAQENISAVTPALNRGAGTGGCALRRSHWKDAFSTYLQEVADEVKQLLVNKTGGLNLLTLFVAHTIPGTRPGRGRRERTALLIWADDFRPRCWHLQASGCTIC